MGKERVAIVGIGQTQAPGDRRATCRSPGSCATRPSGRSTTPSMTWSDIDAVVIGKAPDFFEGVMMPELYLADALGAVGKPMFRVHTAGSVGGSTAIVASDLIAVGPPRAGAHRRLREAVRERGHVGAVGVDAVPAADARRCRRLLRAAHPRRTCARSKAPDHIGILVALKDRLNALKNPYAHLHENDITFDSIKDSMMLWDPIRYSETCPSSDGACAMVLTNEKGGDAAAAAGRPPAWVKGTAFRSEPTMFAGRDQVNPRGGQDCAADVYQQAGITDPRNEIDVVEMYVPFSWFEPMWLENLRLRPEGDGWKFVEDGVTQMDGDLPVNCSRRRALVEPDRRLRHAALRRGGHAGARPGRRAPDRRRPHRARSRLRRRLAVLRHVGRRRRQALAPRRATPTTLAWIRSGRMIYASRLVG